MTQLNRITELLHDPLFIEFDLEQRAPTIFNAVGRTHTERWHSAFIAWLLDPKGSHGLVDFPLRRLIATLAIEDESTNTSRCICLESLLTDADFSNAIVRPSERESTEHYEPTVGEFDVYVTGITLPANEPWKEIRLLIETKVKDKISKEQCNKYISFIEGSKSQPSQAFTIPIFVAPTSYYEDDKPVVELFDDASWIGLDYHDLYKGVIQSC